MLYTRPLRRARLREALVLASGLGIVGAPASIAAQQTGAQPSRVIDEVIVTAQRREESVQDVPVAVSAFSGAMLEDRQIVSTSDLQMNAPNVSYTDTNFGGSNLSIRGIGSLLTAASGDPGVSVHINEVAMPTNLPASEFYDMERIEILRGPQGTLFGRNATGGVLNLITARPHTDALEGNVELEVGDYSNRRLKGMVNVPLGENLAIRAAGMYLERDGYITNAAHEQGVPGVGSDFDGRDLYSFRISGQWDISERASAWALYSRFKEDDDRVRITNQVCTRNDLPTNGCTEEFGFDGIHEGSSTGGLFAMLAGALPLGAGSADDGLVYAFERPDDLNLRRMHTDFQPEYMADEHVFAAGLDLHFDNFTVGLIGGYRDFEYYSRQDYTMGIGPQLNPTQQFVVVPDAGSPTGATVEQVTVDSYPVSDVRGLHADTDCNLQDGTAGVAGGCILQGAPTDRVFSYDHSDSENEYWTIELKVASEFEGPWNFQIGANYASQEQSGNYFVVSNSLDLVTDYGAPLLGLPPLYPGVFNTHSSGPGNEFDSRAVFGELYYDVNERLQITAGLRYNRDHKKVRDASYLYNAANINADGSLGPDPFWVRASLIDFVMGGPPALDDDSRALFDYYGLGDAAANAATPQEILGVAAQVPIAPETGEARAVTGSPDSSTFTAWTGRLGFDWQMSDDTMLYAFYSRGYKPGGFNPAVNPEFQADTPFTFGNERIHAFEVGTKGEWLNGSMIFNTAAFYYDYDGLQIAKIENNTAVNDNVDAEIYGLEVEMLWRPEQMQNLSIDLAYSWLQTSVDGGTELLDMVDRVQGNDDLILLKNIDPGSNTGINYVADLEEVAQITQTAIADGAALSVPGVANYDDPTGINPDGIPAYFSRAYLQGAADAGMIGTAPFDGVLADVGGNDLPNAPEHTLRLGAAYTFNLERGALTARWDYYWQSRSYAREYNSPADRISAWDQHNASLTFESADDRWMVRGFVRNVFDEDNVTGHYLTSDTSGLYRNYFLTEPRIYGVAARLNF